WRTMAGISESRQLRTPQYLCVPYVSLCFPLLLRLAQREGSVPPAAKKVNLARCDGPRLLLAVEHVQTWFDLFRGAYIGYGRRLGSGRRWQSCHSQFRDRWRHWLAD